MFRRTFPHTSLLQCRFLVPPEKRLRLDCSWAGALRTRLLRLLDEKLFRSCFSASNARSNTSIRLLVGPHILKKAGELSDSKVPEQIEFKLAWHHALELESGPAHTRQKTQHNFRKWLSANERPGQPSERIALGMVKIDGLRVGTRYLDSTHVSRTSLC